MSIVDGNNDMDDMPNIDVRFVYQNSFAFDVTHKSGQPNHNVGFAAPF